MQNQTYHRLAFPCLVNQDPQSISYPPPSHHLLTNKFQYAIPIIVGRMPEALQKAASSWLSPSKNLHIVNSKTTITSFSFLTCSMANRRLSQVPSRPTNNRLDVMSCAIQTCSYQALVEQGIGGPLMYAQNMLPLTYGPASPKSLPLKGTNRQSYYPSALITPSITPFLNRSHAGLTPSLSQSSLVYTFNPHINPLIFESTQPTDSPPMDLTTLSPDLNSTNRPNASKKRPTLTLDMEPGNDFAIVDRTRPNTRLMTQVWWTYQPPKLCWSL
ncbi:uncharacterized protein MELLADRAFT_93209 [Melampsora larici-populina 98AG31]|uniref:Uncharacterized protein n=1 Tax=Melampsora larici-populina (strain 98AG31 / pathotype 3-4-7) TaxID=747676 RepID=F4S478_MELLP|nr:uncharacterized protein MELLADRAFT_93209 [Melampsora larici-populina 98AG31]EGG00554.1 hypothetical protein MELLADRAFT_93209 [Melampsora larici-populina 98AG31]